MPDFHRVYNGRISRRRLHMVTAPTRQQELSGGAVPDMMKVGVQPPARNAQTLTAKYAPRASRNLLPGGAAAAGGTQLVTGRGVGGLARKLAEIDIKPLHGSGGPSIRY